MLGSVCGATLSLLPIPLAHSLSASKGELKSAPALRETRRERRGRCDPLCSLLPASSPSPCLCLSSSPPASLCVILGFSLTLQVSTPLFRSMTAPLSLSPHSCLVSVSLLPPLSPSFSCSWPPSPSSSIFPDVPRSDSAFHATFPPPPPSLLLSQADFSACLLALGVSVCLHIWVSVSPSACPLTR